MADEGSTNGGPSAELTDLSQRRPYQGAARMAALRPISAIRFKLTVSRKRIHAGEAS